MQSRYAYLIDWVNSLSIRSCLLVDSFEWLLSGDVVKDIVSHFMGVPEITELF